MQMKRTEITFRSSQGIALVVSLIILSVITLLGVSGMRSTRIETKMSVNHQFKQTSFLAAESALAVLTSPKHEANVPDAVADSEPAKNDNYFTSTGVDGQADISADIDITFIKASTPGELKFSGHGLSVSSLVYQADAVGQVGNASNQSHNRMGVVLIRN
jgi:type IV pilus assembly protein PilX